MTFRGHERGVTSVAYSPDGLLIASGSEDGTVRIWDTRTGEETMPPLRGDGDKVCSVAIAPNGKSVVSGTDSGAVYIWITLTSQSTQPQRLLGHFKAVSSVAFSQDISLLASASQDNTVRVWKIGTGQSLAVISGHKGAVNAVDFSSNGEIMVSGSTDWRVKEIQALRDLHAEPPFRFSSSGQSMVSVSDLSVYLWTQRDMSEWSWIGLDGHMGVVRSAIFSPNGLYIASASDDCTVRIWDARGGQAVAQPQPAARSRRNRAGMSLNSANIVCIRGDLSVHIWNVQTGETNLPPLLGHNDEVLSTAISSDGNLVASSSKDHTVRLWDARTGEALGQPLRGHLKSVTVVQWRAKVSATAFLPHLNNNFNFFNIIKHKYA